MTSVFVHDKSTIEGKLRENIYLHIYGIGDLDEFFWPYTTWYASKTDTGISEIAMLYIGQSLPTLLALSDKPGCMRDLVGSISHLLPRRFYAHLSPGVESVLGKNHHVISHGEHLKMWLNTRSIIDASDCSDTIALGCDDLEEIIEFYLRCYPGNWFDPRMLETEQYFGIREDGTLISIAGIHVFSPEYKVAALGNIATAPEYSNKGYASHATARTCQSLLGVVSDIGLNVKADNDPAISCYEKLGFGIVASYGEYMVERK